MGLEELPVVILHNLKKGLLAQADSVRSVPGAGPLAGSLEALAERHEIEIRRRLLTIGSGDR